MAVLDLVPWLDAIVQDYTSPGPRLACAGWLEEQGCVAAWGMRWSALCPMRWPTVKRVGRVLQWEWHSYAHLHANPPDIISLLPAWLTSHMAVTVGEDSGPEHVFDSPEQAWAAFVEAWEAGDPLQDHVETLSVIRLEGWGERLAEYERNKPELDRRGVPPPYHLDKKLARS